MSKSLVPERGVRKTAATPQPKLARGTRDISPATIATIKVARGTRDMTPLVPLETDDDTIVVDTDPNLTDDLVMDAEAVEAADVGDSEASEASEAGDEVEFVTVMTFDDWDAVAEFAGPDPHASVVPPAARALLSHFDEHSQHYELLARHLPAG